MKTTLLSNGLVFGVSTPKPITGTPNGTKYELRMWHNKFAEIHVTWEDGSITKHHVRESEDGSEWVMVIHQTSSNIKKPITSDEE